jgi:Ca2+-binding EF-hand superfamily protein
MHLLVLTIGPPWQRLRMGRINEKSKIKGLLERLIVIIRDQIRKFGTPADMQRVFKSIDQNGDGTIDKTELYVALTKHCGVSMTPEHMDALWPLLDAVGGILLRCLCFPQSSSHG